MTKQTPLPWLNEAFKHNGLKEIKGAKSNPTIVKWLISLNAWWREDSTPWCHPGNTEILTAQGWQRFDDLLCDEVYQVDENGKMTLTNYIPVVKEYKGKGYHLKTRTGVNLISDKDHRYWGKRIGSGFEPEFFTLDQVGHEPENQFCIEAPHYEGEDNPDYDDDQLHLIAAFIADGKYKYNSKRILNNKHIPHRVEFEVSRPHKIESLTALGPKHVYTQSKVYGPLTKTPLTIFSFEYTDWFREAFGDYKVLKDEFINSLSARQAAHFIECYRHYDGSSRDQVIFSSHPEVVGQLSTLMLKANMTPVVRLTSGGALSKKPCYRISYGRVGGRFSIDASEVTEVELDEKLYCVSVPEGRIIVRTGNSTPMVVGNCGVFVAHCLKTAMRPIPKNWYRALDYRKYGTKLDKPAYGCIATISRKGGGHVFFVVGQTTNGDIVGYGGNQSDAVNYRVFPRSQCQFCWPDRGPGIPSKPAAIRYQLPVYSSNLKQIGSMS